MSAEDMDRRAVDIVVAVNIAGLIVLCALALTSCGGASSQLRERYAAKVAECIAEERGIIARERANDPSDDEEIDAELAAARASCDAELEALEGGE